MTEPISRPVAGARLADKLDLLALRIRSVAAEMEYYAGFSARQASRARMLERQADSCRQDAKLLRMQSGKMEPNEFLYYCPACGKTQWRVSDKKWMNSYCLDTGRNVRIRRVTNKGEP